MKIHLCLYLNGQEVININEVRSFHFLDDCVCIITQLNNTFWYLYSEFDKIEVDYYD